MHILFLNVESKVLNSMCASSVYLRWWQKHELVANELAKGFWGSIETIEFQVAFFLFLIRVNTVGSRGCLKLYAFT